MFLVLKLIVFLWPFALFAVSNVQCKSFVLTNSKSIKSLTKRDAVLSETFPKESSDVNRPDIYSFLVESNIAYRYATTTVSNKVANPSNTSKEISFTVTLPDSAFISRFLMVIKDKVYEAYVKEKEEAKKDYQEAVNRGDTAGHVELSARDSNLFTVSVNVESSSKVTFNLTYEQLLTRTLGQYENIINVNPGQIVKSFRIDVNIEESAPIVGLDVSDLKTSNEINAVNSKSINAKIEQPTNKTARITWTPDNKQQQNISKDGIKGQIIVRYDVDRSSDSNQILVDEGYFVHFFAPTNLKTLSKHVLFALDISGSMAGRKIEQLREALTLILSDIGEGDFFSLILFSDNVQLWTLKGTVGEASPTWSYDEVTTHSSIEINDRFIIPANAENIAKAKAFANTLNETGGTNIIAALRESLQIAQWGQNRYGIKAKPLIIFLTDGQPNVEMSDPEEITKAIKKLNNDNYPIFSLAFGEGADYEFLRKLSLSNSGFARNIYVASDTSLQLKNFYKQVASPLLSNVSFAYIPGQVDANTLTKSVFNHLYDGSELMVAGKLADNSTSLGGNLTGTASEGFFCVIMSPEIPLNRTPGHLEKLWAYVHIKELLDKDLISDEKNSIFKQKALNLSLQYGFVTPLTSLVVVKPNETTPTASDTMPSLYAEADGSQIIVRAGSSSKLSVRVSANLMHNAGAPLSYAPLSYAPNNKKMMIGLSGSHLSPSVYYDPGPVAFAAMSAEDNYPEVVYNIAAESSNISEPLNISRISWLNDKTEIKFPSSNNSYSVFSGDAPNMEFQSCIVPNSNNTVSHCRHLAHCVIPEILKSFEDFVPYGEGCIIDARFVGICCPPLYSIQKVDSTTMTPNITTMITTSAAPATGAVTTLVTTTEKQ